MLTAVSQSSHPDTYANLLMTQILHQAPPLNGKSILTYGQDNIQDFLYLFCVQIHSECVYKVCFYKFKRNLCASRMLGVVYKEGVGITPSLYNRF